MTLRKPYLSGSHFFALGNRPGRIQKELTIDLPIAIGIKRHQTFHGYW
jgi:hypothetical protein